MDLGLKGRRALVMGSTRGMGLGIAQRLSAEGAAVQRELALGGMQVIQRDKCRNERACPLESHRQAAGVAVVYGDADKVARDLAAATPFRRRLEQSRILVVPVVERWRRCRPGQGMAL